MRLLKIKWFFEKNGIFMGFFKIRSGGHLLLDNSG